MVSRFFATIFMMAAVVLVILQFESILEDTGGPEQFLLPFGFGFVGALLSFVKDDEVRPSHG